MTTTSHPAGPESQEPKTGIVRRLDVGTAPIRELRFVPAIECILEGGSLALATDVVAQLVEYDVAPLPVMRPGIAGLGRVEGRLVVSLAPGRKAPLSGPRRTKGVLLQLAAESETAWALEVQSVVSFVEAAVRAGSENPLEPWLSRAVTRDERDVAWLDAAELVRLMTRIGEPTGDSRA